jgi:hypothetical protein
MAAMIAIYPDRATADAVATDLREHHHVPDAGLHVGEFADRQRALQAEFEDETADGATGGQHGFTARAMAGGAVRFGLIGALIGLVVGLPVGYFLFVPADAVLTRLGVGALIWMLFGSVVGALAGAGIGPGNPAEPLTDSPGVPVRVDDASAELEAVLEQYDPIRIDTFDGERRLSGA